MNTITTLNDEQLDTVQGGILTSILAGAAAVAAAATVVKSCIDIHKILKEKKAAKKAQ